MQTITQQPRHALLLSLCLLAPAAWLPGAALAQTYPAKPIRMIVPYTPGGYTDTMARGVGEPLGNGEPL